MDPYFTKTVGQRFSRQRFDTIPELLRAYGWEISDEKFAETFPWITHDTAAKPEYRVSRRGGDDGTLVFTLERIADAVNPLLQRTTYFKPTGPWERIEDVRYVVTGVSVANVFGTADLRVGRYPGRRETVRIGVCCIHSPRHQLKAHP